jgi:D-alanyl-D-alanine carboxypeptidase
MKFRAASISKTFTAAAILKLSEDGRLKLDESPLKYLRGRIAETQALSKITIRMLLTHRSGLADLDTAALMGEQRSKGGAPVTAENAVGRALSKGLMFTPGSSWAYSNAGYVLLSMVMDEASKAGYEEYLHKTLIGPLNLAGTDTTTKPPSKEIAGPHMRCIYRLKDGTWADTTETFFNWNRGGGDLISTAPDLNRFHRALRSGGILSKETFEVMRRFSATPLPIPELAAAGCKSGYGCGYGRLIIGSPKTTLEGHVGGYSGAVSSMIYWVEGDTYISISSSGRYLPGYEMALIMPIIDFLRDRSE